MKDINVIRPATLKTLSILYLGLIDRTHDWISRVIVVVLFRVLESFFGAAELSLPLGILSSSENSGNISFDPNLFGCEAAYSRSFPLMQVRKYLRIGVYAAKQVLGII